jgi:hypothetical protein
LRQHHLISITPAHCSGANEGRLAVPERPVVPVRPDEAEENVLPSDSETLIEIIDDAFVESTLLFECAALSQRQLDEGQVLASADVEEVRIIDEVGLIMFHNHLKAGVFGRLQDFDHSCVNDGADGLPVFRGLSFDQVDTCEWYGFAP